MTARDKRGGGKGRDYSRLPRRMRRAIWKGNNINGWIERSPRWIQVFPHIEP